MRYCFFILFIAVFITACSPDYSGHTPEEQVEIAVSLAKEREYSKARSLLREAAEGGSLCAQQLVAELYHPQRFTGPQDGWYFDLSQRWTPDDALAHEWSEKLVTSLRQEAEEGNALAMLWMYFGHVNFFTGSGLGSLEKDEDAANMWLQRAANAENATALRFLAEKAFEEDNLSLADSLFQRAAHLGDGLAYSFWAGNYLDQRFGSRGPIRHFELAAQALNEEAPGAYIWVKNELQKLREEAHRSNPEAIRYLFIADSLGIPELLANTPESNQAQQPYFPSICPMYR